jgi:hypothetical protein
MRCIHVAWLLFVLIAAGCSAPRAVPPVAPTRTATADDSTLANFVPPTGPIATAKALTEADGSLRWLDGPIPYTVQQMTYEEAHAYIPMLSSDYPPDSPLTRQTPVSLVAFRGRWLLQPMGPPGAQPVEYTGCLFVLFNAADGKFIAGGDTTCPGQ